jgi:hypothetical protein
MSTKSEKNRFTTDTLSHITTIEAATEAYNHAKRVDSESRQQLECAKTDVKSIFNDRDADLVDCIERLVVADAKVRLLEHRLSAGADNSVTDRLLELAGAVDEAQGFVSGASNYISRVIRERKIKEIAAELDLPPGKISADEITVRLHPKAVSAERLAVNRLSQSGDLEKLSEATVLQHVAGVLLKLRRLAVFEFEDIGDSTLEPTGNVSDSATTIDT